MVLEIETIDENLGSQHEATFGKDDLIEGILTWLKRNDTTNGARLYVQCHEDLGYALMAKVGKGPLAPALVKLFVQAKDFYKAGQVLESLGMIPEAAQAFERAEIFGSAAEMYSRLGETAKAAQMLERSGNYAQAAEFYARSNAWCEAARNYEHAQDPFRAGEAYSKVGDAKKALQMLQRVEADHYEYPKALGLLGPLLMEMGFHEVAVQKLKTLADHEPPSERNIAVFYSLAQAQEALGQIQEARENYAKVLQVDLGYQDVEKRYQALREGAPRPQAAPPKAGTTLTTGSSTGSGIVFVERDRKFFESCVFFQHLNYDELRQILALVQRCSAQAKQVLTREETVAPGVFLIRTGEVVVSMQTGPDAEQIGYARLKAGDHFGELSLIEGCSTKFTFSAVGDCTYYLVPAKELNAVLERQPALKAKMHTNLVRALDENFSGLKAIMQRLYTRHA